LLGPDQLALGGPGGAGQVTPPGALAAPGPLDGLAELSWPAELGRLAAGRDGAGARPQTLQ
jgi:hypothetical protein